MENSKIQWTDHTFNPWTGCAKVSEGCLHCYAEAQEDHRFGRALWGHGQARHLTSDEYLTPASGEGRADFATEDKCLVGVRALPRCEGFAGRAGLCHAPDGAAESTKQ